MVIVNCEYMRDREVTSVYIGIWHVRLLCQIFARKHMCLNPK